MRLENKVAIVTGAAQGIGAVYAQALAKEGAHVVIVDVKNCEKTKSTVEKNVADIEVMAHCCDVSKENDVTRLVETVMDRYGRLDVLVNNAAVFASLDRKPFEEIPVKEWDHVMAVNLRGVFLCARAVTSIMKKQKLNVLISDYQIAMAVLFLLKIIVGG